MKLLNLLQDKCEFCMIKADLFITAELSVKSIPCFHEEDEQ